MDFAWWGRPLRFTEQKKKCGKIAVSLKRKGKKLIDVMQLFFEHGLELIDAKAVNKFGSA